jgi:2-dehydropantoate 2-reductase
MQEKEKLRVAVIGLGGVGGYYGGKLASYYSSREDVEIIFIARGKHLEKIKEQGLSVITTNSTFSVFPSLATDDLSALPSLDLLIVCIKSYDLDSLEQFRDAVTERTIILPLMNGVNNTQNLKKIFPRSTVLDACVYIISKQAAPGIIRESGNSNQIFFGSAACSEGKLKSIETLLTEAGIEAKATASILEKVWEKFSFVSPIASITSGYGKPIGYILENADHRQMLEGLINEIITLSKAKNIFLSPGTTSSILSQMAQLPYEALSSIYTDLMNGKRTEIETLTGYVVREGRALGLDLPLHNRIYEELRSLTPAH